MFYGERPMDGFSFAGAAHSFDPVDLERLRRSIALLAPNQPSGLDRSLRV